MNKRLKIYRITVFILLLCWMVLIFVLSGENADDSSETSGKAVAKLIRLFIPNFAELSESVKLEIKNMYQFIVRKVAHFTIYAILGILSVLNTVTSEKISLVKRFLISALFCLVYAISDEIHQLFVPGRSCEIRDVLIDFTGALIGILFTMFLVHLLKKKTGGYLRAKKRITES